MAEGEDVWDRIGLKFSRELKQELSGPRAERFVGDCLLFATSAFQQAFLFALESNLKGCTLDHAILKVAVEMAYIELKQTESCR